MDKILGLLMHLVHLLFMARQIPLLLYHYLVNSLFLISVAQKVPNASFAVAHRPTTSGAQCLYLTGSSAEYGDDYAGVVVDAKSQVPRIYARTTFYAFNEVYSGNKVRPTSLSCKFIISF